MLRCAARDSGSLRQWLIILHALLYYHAGPLQPLLLAAAPGRRLLPSAGSRATCLWSHHSDIADGSHSPEMAVPLACCSTMPDDSRHLRNGSAVTAGGRDWCANAAAAPGTVPESSIVFEAHS